MNFGGNGNNLGMMRTLEARGIAGNADGSTDITQLLRPSSREEIADRGRGPLCNIREEKGSQQSSPVRSEKGCRYTHAMSGDK